MSLVRDGAIRVDRAGLEGPSQRAGPFEGLPLLAFFPLEGQTPFHSTPTASPFDFFGALLKSPFRLKIDCTPRKLRRTDADF